MSTTTSAVSLNLSTITCVKTGEVGHDELYITYSADNAGTTTYPSGGNYHSIEDGEVWNVGLVISYQNTLFVELWDSDTGGDDPRGSYTYSRDDASMSLSETYSASGGTYIVDTIPAD